MGIKRKLSFNKQKKLLAMGILLILSICMIGAWPDQCEEFLNWAQGKTFIKIKHKPTSFTLQEIGQFHNRPYKFICKYRIVFPWQEVVSGIKFTISWRDFQSKGWHPLSGPYHYSYVFKTFNIEYSPDSVATYEFPIYWNGRSTLPVAGQSPGANTEFLEVEAVMIDSDGIPCKEGETILWRDYFVIFIGEDEEEPPEPPKDVTFVKFIPPYPPEMIDPIGDNGFYGNEKITIYYEYYCENGKYRDYDIDAIYFRIIQLSDNEPLEWRCWLPEYDPWWSGHLDVDNDDIIFGELITNQFVEWDGTFNHFSYDVNNQHPSFTKNPIEVEILFTYIDMPTCHNKIPESQWNTDGNQYGHKIYINMKPLETKIYFTKRPTSFTLEEILSFELNNYSLRATYFIEEEDQATCKQICFSVKQGNSQELPQILKSEDQLIIGGDVVNLIDEILWDGKLDDGSTPETNPTVIAKIGFTDDNTSPNWTDYTDELEITITEPTTYIEFTGELPTEFTDQDIAEITFQHTFNYKYYISSDEQADCKKLCYSVTKEGVEESPTVLEPLIEGEELNKIKTTQGEFDWYGELDDGTTPVVGDEITVKIGFQNENGVWLGEGYVKDIPINIVEYETIVTETKISLDEPPEMFGLDEISGFGMDVEGEDKRHDFTVKYQVADDEPESIVDYRFLITQWVSDGLNSGWAQKEYINSDVSNGCQDEGIHYWDGKWEPPFHDLTSLQEWSDITYEVGFRNASGEIVSGFLQSGNIPVYKHQENTPKLVILDAPDSHNFNTATINLPIKLGIYTHEHSQKVKAWFELSKDNDEYKSNEIEAENYWCNFFEGDITYFSPYIVWGGYYEGMNNTWTVTAKMNVYDWLSGEELYNPNTHPEYCTATKEITFTGISSGDIRSIPVEYDYVKSYPIFDECSENDVNAAFRPAKFEFSFNEDDEIDTLGYDDNRPDSIDPTWEEVDWVIGNHKDTQGAYILGVNYIWYPGATFYGYCRNAGNRGVIIGITNCGSGDRIAFTVIHEMGHHVTHGAVKHHYGENSVPIDALDGVCVQATDDFSTFYDSATRHMTNNPHFCNHCFEILRNPGNIKY